MSLSAESQKSVDAYLGALRKQLRELMDEDVNDIVAEIRMHILDRTFDPAKTSDDAAPEAVAATLAALGPPPELAERYRTDELLKRALSWAGLSLVGLIVFCISVVGFGLGGGVFVLGVLKVMDYHGTGIYGQFTDTSSSLGFQSGGPRAGQHELLGFWLLPLGLLGGPALFFLTARLGLWSLRKFWRPRAWR
jgi:hypothetical protein